MIEKTREPEVPEICVGIAVRLRDPQVYMDASEIAAGWIESAGLAILLYEKALKLKCTCETANGCDFCDLILEARSLTKIEP